MFQFVHLSEGKTGAWRG